MKTIKRILMIILVAEGLGISSAVQAVLDASWKGDSTGNWSNPTRWDTNPNIPDGVDHIARITNSITSGRGVALESTSRTIGHLYIGDSDGNPNNFTLTTTGGTLIFDVSSGNATINKSFGAQDTINPAITLNDPLVIHHLGTSVGILNIVGAISLGIYNLTVNQSSTVAADGVVLGNAVTGSGNLILNGLKYPAFGLAPSTGGAGPFGITGKYELSVNGAAGHTGKTILNSGVLQINQSGSAGSLLETSAIEFRGGALSAVHPAGATNILNDNAPFVVDGGGVYVFTHSTATVTPAPTESVGGLELRKGTFEFRLRSGTAGKQFTFADLTRTGANNRATVAFGPTTASGAGWDPGLHGQVFFSNIHGAPATNSPFLGGWAVFGNYQGFAAYDTASGVVQAATLALAASSDDPNANFQAQGNITLTAGDKNYNSLAFQATKSSTVNLNGYTITLISGGIAFGGDSTIRTNGLTNGVIQAGSSANNTLYLHSGMSPENLGLVAAVIQDNGTNPLTVVKAGPGVVAFEAAMIYTGPTVVECGTLKIGARNNLPTSTDLRLRPLGIFALNGFDQTVNGLAGDGTVALGTNTLTVTGTVDVSEPVNALTLTGTGGLSLGNGAKTHFAIDVNQTPQNAARLVMSDAALTVGSGCSVELTLNETPPSLPATYSLIACGSRTGTFSSAKVLSPAGVAAELTQSATGVTVTITQKKAAGTFVIVK